MMRSISRTRRRVGRFTNGFPRARPFHTIGYLAFGIVGYVLLCHGNPLFNHNWFEVKVLGKLGKELSGLEKAYFPAHQIGEWREKIARRYRELISTVCKHYESRQ
jgi:hypothetical protein